MSFLQSTGPASRLRLAPTPSGYLHIGNAYNFILNWLAARINPGAKLLLRIDDLDQDRKRPEYVQDVFDTLFWLGLDWDEGPADPDDFERTWSQRHRLHLYHQVLAALREKQVLFACAKSRRDLEPYQGEYPVAFREQGLDLEHPDVAWRIKTPRSPGNDLPADFIVRRRDGLPAYQVASMADDLHFGITDIIRGLDLEPSTHAQIYIAICLDATAFTRIHFFHHPLILNTQGVKLSKSKGADALATWREKRQTPVALYQNLASWLGLPSDSVFAANDLLKMLQNLR
ncbi:MAG: tRNA glutamyl-Q synthetase [Bacteroidetes bacterium]|nr:MAG: tRNA glutamyl-Q synthetase [Bacteroidota bacterium]